MPRNEQAVKVKAMEIQLVVGLFGFCSPVQSTTGSTVSSGTLLPLGVESGPLVSSWPSATLPHPELSVAFEGLPSIPALLYCTCLCSPSGNEGWTLAGWGQRFFWVRLEDKR